MNTKPIIIRPAAPKDCEDILSIYSYYVKNTCISFEYEPPVLSDFQKRIENIQKNYPVFVCEQNNKIAGYCYASSFRGYQAYRWDVETSIYIDSDYQNAGIGTALYRALENACTKQGFAVMYACIAYPNPQSVRFHQHCGFTETAHFKKSGYKHGKWIDILFMEKRLNGGTAFVPHE